MGASALGGCGSDLHCQITSFLTPESQGSTAAPSSGWPWLAAWSLTSSSARVAAASVFCILAASDVCAERLAATEALAQVTVASQPEIISLLARLTKDPDTAVRKAAAVALSRASLRGNWTAEGALVNILGEVSESEEVVLAALDTMTVISTGSLAALEALRCCLSAEAWTVRRSAVTCLSSVAASGDKVAVGLLQQAMNDESRWVRVSAIEAVVKLAWRGDRDAMAGVSSQLSDEIWCVRAAALSGLSKLAEVGDDSALSSVAGQLEDPFPSVRIAALEALTNIAPKGHREAIALACGRLCDADPEVRLEAIEAVIHLAETGDANAIMMLATCSRDDEDADVRDAAETGVGRL
eukprot:TRINITY_DN94237_c0_g1_i1.p1 TRINITY_DN94237_c0_g1~~TRINITY_DN94237_c0_g1_i1.p1  ORF type:complete len:379 (+),score=74.08 TRINITY_DN94237_c0_g1_i1:77-1138(+)